MLLLLWLTSLALPSASNYDGSPGWNDATGLIYGYEILLFGWTDLGWGSLGWLANPLFLAFLALRLDGAPRCRRSTILAAMLALAYAGALLWRKGYGPDGWIQTPGGDGYILWLAVIGIALLWTVLAAILGWRARSLSAAIAG